MQICNKWEFQDEHFLKPLKTNTIEDEKLKNINAAYDVKILVLPFVFFEQKVTKFQNCTSQLHTHCIA